MRETGTQEHEAAITTTHEQPTRQEARSTRWRDTLVAGEGASRREWLFPKTSEIIAAEDTIRDLHKALTVFLLKRSEITRCQEKLRDAALPPAVKQAFLDKEKFQARAASATVELELGKTLALARVDMVKARATLVSLLPRIEWQKCSVALAARESALRRMYDSVESGVGVAKRKADVLAQQKAGLNKVAVELAKNELAAREQILERINDELHDATTRLRELHTIGRELRDLLAEDEVLPNVPSPADVREAERLKDSSPTEIRESV